MFCCPQQVLPTWATPHPTQHPATNEVATQKNEAWHRVPHPRDWWTKTMGFWLVVDLPLWKKYESQLGWFFPIYGKIKHVPNHQSGLYELLWIYNGFQWDCYPYANHGAGINLPMWLGDVLAFLLGLMFQHQGAHMGCRMWRKSR